MTHFTIKRQKERERREWIERAERERAERLAAEQREQQHHLEIEYRRRLATDLYLASRQQQWLAAVTPAHPQVSFESPTLLERLLGRSLSDDGFVRLYRSSDS